MNERIDVPWSREVIFRARGSFVASINDSSGRSLGIVAWHYPCQGPYTLETQFIFDSGSLVLDEWPSEDQDIEDFALRSGSLRSASGEWTRVSREMFHNMVRGFLFQILDAEEIPRSCTYSLDLCFSEFPTSRGPQVEPEALRETSMSPSIRQNELEFRLEGGASQSQIYRGWREMSAGELLGPETWEPSLQISAQIGRLDLFFDSPGILGRALFTLPAAEQRRAAARSSETCLESPISALRPVLEKLRVPCDERSRLLLIVSAKDHWNTRLRSVRNEGYEELILED